ncbi:MAG: aspartate--tRNA ligase [Bacteroidetes bacterium SW_10_40_5]|nr:MAG: aspartate--tRNA ligase [Bacteroidetes bacterium SW_10_40_5]
MLRTHNCGELRIDNVDQQVILSGWVQRNRDLGGMTFIDLRDRYGITQLVFNMETQPELCKKARQLGREYVIKINGQVMERSNKNPEVPTGNVEILVDSFKVLNTSKTPPFTIEEDTDGGEELRMKYRYLDLRRANQQQKIILRHQMLLAARNYLSDQEFIEVETPYLIKSTPEGARDFVVPSRLHNGEFYALPQSPQTFKQLIMMGGFDKYFQVVRCFRDEDFRADRQPEFTQIDCEMTFVDRDDIIHTFNGLVRHLFKSLKGIEIGKIPVISYQDAINYYGTDKPDIRFGMQFKHLNDVLEGTDFKVFADVLEKNGVIAGINATGCASYSRKDLDQLTEFVKQPNRGMQGLVWVKYQEDGSLKSSVDKFFGQDALQQWAERFEAKPGDLMLILAGPAQKTKAALGDLRLEMGTRLDLRKFTDYKPLWVIDFPLMEWDEEDEKYTFAHHPFTAPLEEDKAKLDENPEEARASSYDFVLNGHECASGSIRIHNREMQEKYFNLLGISKEEGEQRFGFLLNALEYGAPPHGGIAFGFDRWCALFNETETIREVIPFPKNNAGRDLMIDAPSKIDQKQFKELGLQLRKPEK